MAQELRAVSVARAQEERDAVVGARHHHGQTAHPQPGGGPAAQPVGEDHGVVRRPHLVHLGLQDGAQVRRVVVEAASVEPDVHDVGRTRRTQVDAAREDLAGERDEASLGAAGTFAHAADPTPYVSAVSKAASMFSGGTKAWMLWTVAKTKPPPGARSSMRRLTSSRTSSGVPKGSTRWVSTPPPQKVTSRP